MSENKNIYSAFVAAQSAFSPLIKTHTNPHLKAKYADLSACVEAVMDALNKNGIALMQNTHIGADGGVTVETVFIHSSGERLSNGGLFVPAVKLDPQGYGSALTYARRYSLMAACGIAPEDDDGNASAEAKKKQDDFINGQAAKREKWEHSKADLELKIKEAPGMDELKAAWISAQTGCKSVGDGEMLAKLEGLKDARKLELSGGSNE